MPTLAAYRQRMLELEPFVLGHTYTATALATTSVTVTALGNARFSKTWGEGKQILRPDTSDSADRLRRAEDFDEFKGQFIFSQEATVYADTTVGTGKVEVHNFDPFDLDLAVQETLRTTRFYDSVHLPMNQSGRYFLHDFSWITQPSHIFRVGRRGSAVMTLNRHFEKWNGVDSGGLLVPDDWTLGGVGVTFARDTTNVQRGGRSLAITTPFATGTVDQTVRVMETGVSNDSIRGEIVTGVSFARSGIASSVLVRVTSEDAAGNVLATSDSSFHDGDDDWQELSVEHTVDSAAEIIRLAIRLQQIETGEVDELYLVKGTLTDDVRRDARGTVWLDHSPQFEQGGTLTLHSLAGAATNQLVIETLRPFHEFDQTRVLAGTADSDNHDAPLNMIAQGALWRFFMHLATESGEKAHKELSEVHRRAYRALAANYQYVPDDSIRPGLELLPQATRVGARVR